ncbi:hypothetical protein [Rathayibacter sp. AY1F3]|uniref:hypothetical protein n=1 Tax=Rathayibacter sp. AY1F3 TaxID=2080558 RepID=UPI0011B05174|nr:hypothetical protein [Rathayibacter sp. AY1F3]
MPDNLEDKHMIALKSFVLRARRVREHSLAKDIRLLVDLQSPKFNVSFDPESHETKIVWSLPPEEQLESAAARVRPLILQDDPTYHAKAMNAILFFAQKGEAPKPVIDALRLMKKRWAALIGDGNAGGYYEVMVQEASGAPVERINDGGLALAWIYGDVVHADAEHRKKGQVFGVRERYQAAVPLVAKIMLQTLSTLNLIEQLHKRGAIPKLGPVFDEEVTVKEPISETVADVYVGEYDANGNLPPTPAMDEEFGEGWRRFSEVFGEGGERSS